MNIRLILLSHLAFVISLNVWAQKPHFGEKKRSKRITKHITYLASDELGGRLSASDNDRKSAEYIAKQYERIGLEPAGENDSYYQYMSTPDLRLAKSNTSLVLDKYVLKLFKEFYPLSASSNKGTYEGEAVNVNYGIEDEGLKHHDYQDKEVSGKVVLIKMDIPGGVHPHNRYISWSGIEYRATYAKSKGAKAVVYYTDNEELQPSGTLAKTLDNAGIPIFFVKKDLSSLDVTTARFNLDILMITKIANNVLGFIDNQADQTVVVGAHHDHLGRGQKGGSLAEIPGDIHNGADDNASGVAGLFEIAQAIVKKPKKYKNNNYLFIAFSGEEQGLIGSKYFVKSPLMQKQNVNFMINMDMIGHLDSTKKTLIINGVGSSPEWNKAISEVSYSTSKIAKIKTTESGIGASDHTSFYLANIPAVHFFTGQHQHYHKPSDDPSIINYGGEAFVISYMLKILQKANEYGEFSFTETTKDEPSRMNFKVTLGIMPDYIFDGEGMRVDGVKPERPGSKAGMLKGDIIIGMGDFTIVNIQDYMKALSSYNKNDQTIVTIRRNKEVKLLNVTF
ncbi:MAG: Aminopeptidase YwaD [Bacteroidia bacterium]|nr:MAG: Aminopeptidase YwaD [Bacteroidia bacterium]